MDRSVIVIEQARARCLYQCYHSPNERVRRYPYLVEACAFLDEIGGCAADSVWAAYEKIGRKRTFLGMTRYNVYDARGIRAWAPFPEVRAVLCDAGTYVEEDYRRLGVAKRLWVHQIEQSGVQAIDVATASCEGYELVMSLVKKFSHLPWLVNGVYRGRFSNVPARVG